MRHDVFALLDEGDLAQLEEPSVRETGLRKKKPPKPEIIRPWGGMYQSRSDSFEQLLDPQYGPWSVVYATWLGEKVPVVVSPESEPDLRDIALHLHPSTGLLYVRGVFPNEDGSFKRGYLQRYLKGMLNKPRIIQVNHKTRQTLDNRLDALEVVIPIVNQHHRESTGRGKTGYRGVTMLSRKRLKSGRPAQFPKKPYKVEFSFGPDYYYWQTWENPEEAARVYDRNVTKLLRGVLPDEDLVRLLNFPEEFRASNERWQIDEDVPF